MKRTIPPGCLGLALLLSILVLFPLCLAQLFFTAGSRLHLSPAASVLVLFAIIFGSAINIPIKRNRPVREMSQILSRMHGMDKFVHPFEPRQRESVIAINVGGCIVPCGVAFYQLLLLAQQDSAALLASLGGVLITTVVCYGLAEPVEGIGITMPTLVPPLTAALTALILCAAISSPDHAPPVAFVSGVLGTLIGADLLNLNLIHRISPGFASIGGAGTFDGIVLSGFVATLLA